jgi:hypothetical protein
MRRDIGRGRWGILLTVGWALSLILGGCGWLVPKPAELFPDEIAPGWRLAAEGALPLEDLPAGAAGGWGATWAREDAWIWSEVVTMGEAAQAAGLFTEVVGSLGTFEEDRIGDEGVRLAHGPSGLVLHMFRVGSSLALIGSLAQRPEKAPSPETVRQAALVLASRLPHLPPTAFVATRGSSHAALRPESTAPVEVEVELRGPDGTTAGILTLRVYVSLLGESGGICRYRLAFHLARVALRDVPGDGPFRGPLDLFLAGTADLPCDRLTFLTPEIAHLMPGEEKVFDEPGPSLGELDCALPCWQANPPVNLNVILRDSDDDLLDLLGAFVLALGKTDPRAVPLWEVANDLIRTYGVQGGNPPDPIRTAELSRGTTLGGAQVERSLSLGTGGVKLEFSGTLAIAGSCQRVGTNIIHCRVPEGAAGTLTLTAKRSPAGAVSIRAEALPPGWPPFGVKSGWGEITALYTFTVPGGTAGRRFELIFRAWTAGVVGELELRVLLDVIPPEISAESPTWTFLHQQWTTLNHELPEA